MTLDGISVLVLTTNYGTEQDELNKPVEVLREAGARVTVAAQKREPVETLVSDRRPGEAVEPDTTLSDAAAEEYDAVVVPGGTVNADTLRTDGDARRLLSAFADAGKPVAAICHGPWLLVDTGLARGRELTSYPSLRPDLENAGARWVDREVVVDTTGGHPLITSRKPDDLEAFSGAVVRTLEGRAG
ncbi:MULTISPECIES: type 1 glutamine amidotransferase domain-containing protein [Streptomyces]|uniref:ThiJ or PfpI family protein n=1 Tax=Streptomyces venezuelae (strain ATCC 10712 / CBS 650.69 / DSM 40230 / JCM 4526 / NBRC 13096 / PD 04745) TaxID=953739 RepID=F2RJ93_STRVP|nr:type 1 glutamine amidotransferase domain-containing protein [Streptomyces venezuelae]APE25576.1 protease [Streptomyces venezuelae]QES02914.1 type 1 glutamine amidotransferase [Streptomyces venezuelae ATCC 10712]QES09932.1 type 1 glutamine amidotransferase [Streptomyces venezuelae]CCA60219.1 ThiJ or PfpI family protein [Streptomyces venezuelae ATCC 10712]